MTRPIMERIWDRTMPIPESGCYVWMGALGTHGYGRIRISGRIFRVHNVAYELLVGSIQAGLLLDHLCRVRACWRPEHLEPVTNRENIMRGTGITAINAKKTHCHRGHALSGANLGTFKSGRYCRECQRARSAAHYQANK